MLLEMRTAARGGNRGGGDSKRGASESQTYQLTEKNASGSRLRLPREPHPVPVPLLRAAVSWLYVHGFITEHTHDSAWQALEAFV